MARLSEILLCNLQLCHLLRLVHGVEDGGVGLTGLEIQRTVLRLQDHIVAELTVEILEFRNRLFYAILTLMGCAIHERAPHHDTAEGLHGISQCVGTVGMRAVIIEGAGLAFRIGLHQETAEVGNQLIDLLGLRLPPSLHLFVQRISRLHGLTTVESLGGNRHRRGEVYRQVDLDAIGAQDICYLLYLIKIEGRKHLGRRIYIVEHGTVDTDRGVGTCIFPDERHVDGFGLPLVAVPSRLRVFQRPEDAASGIAALYRTVQIVPMVQQTEFIVRS